MLPNYKDITERAGEPDWYDQHGAPRYGDFNPGRVDIYCLRAALIVIACQNCGRRFRIATHQKMWEFTPLDPGCGPDLYHWEMSFKEPMHFTFGDPPRHDEEDDERCAGETMSSELVGIEEFWCRRRPGKEWHRHPIRETIRS